MYPISASQVGTPFGDGNVAVIVDETADLAAAADKILASKTFDNATSCSSENAVVVVDAIYDAFAAEMARTGGWLVSDDTKIKSKLWVKGHLNPQAIAQDADKMIAAFGLSEEAPEGTNYIAVETNGIGADHPVRRKTEPCSERLPRTRFRRCSCHNRRTPVASGRGAFCWVHTQDDERPAILATAIPTSRVIVNQAHTFATGGSFTNGMPFSLSMGCGSWGGARSTLTCIGGISFSPRKSCGKFRQTNRR